MLRSASASFMAFILIIYEAVRELEALKINVSAVSSSISPSESSLGACTKQI